MRCVGLFLLLICAASCSEFTQVESVFIANNEAESYIKNKEITSVTPVDLPESQDSVYRLLSITPKEHQSYFEFFLRTKTSFYVFQNSNLIYQSLAHTFYPKLHLPAKAFSFYTEHSKILHQVKLLSDDTLKIVFKQKRKHTLNEVFKLADLDRLKREKPKGSSLPWIEVTAHSSLNDQVYTDALVFGDDSILVDAKVKIRGASSKSFPKKQLVLKAKKSVRVNSINLKKAVLYSPYIDRSLIRNKLTYDLFGALNNSPIESAFTQVLLNGNYEGIYLLLPHPKSQFRESTFGANKNAFLVQIDRGPNDIIHDSVHSDYIAPAYIFEVPSKPTFDQKVAIDSCLMAFEKAVLANDLSVINIQSFIDLVLINELSKNVDAYRLSTYLAFDGAKIFVPTVWDFNIAWGLAKHAQGFATDGFVIDGENKTAAPLWWQSIWSNEAFQTKLRARYKYLRNEVLSNERISNRIQNVSDLLQNDADLNFDKWNTFNKNIWPNKYKSSSHEEEVSRMKEWVLNRLNWLDSQWID